MSAQTGKVNETTNRRSLEIAVVLFFLLVVAGCGGGGLLPKLSTSSGAVSGKIVELAQIEAGALDMVATQKRGIADKSANASNPSVANLTVSIAGCSSTSVTNSSGAFNIPINPSCAGSNLIITASSAGGTYIAKKLVSISGNGTVNAGDIGKNETVEGLVIEQTGENMKEIFGYSTVKDALATLDSEKITNIKNKFDKTADGKLSFDDLDSDKDGIIGKVEASSIQETSQQAAIETFPGMDVINKYHEAADHILDDYSSLVTEDSICWKDPGTPTDKSDDTRCGWPAGQTPSNALSSTPIQPSKFSNIRIRQKDATTVTWTERMTTMGSNDYYQYPEVEKIIDNDVEHTLKLSDNKWRISEETWTFGRLTAKLQLDRSAIAKGGSILATCALRNDSDYQAVGCFNANAICDTIVLTRPDGRRLTPRRTYSLTRPPDCVGWEKNQEFSGVIDLGASNLGGLNEYRWVDADGDPLDPTYYDIDIPGEYSVAYYSPSLYYCETTSPSSFCSKSETLKFTVN